MNSVILEYVCDIEGICSYMEDLQDDRDKCVDELEKVDIYIEIDRAFDVLLEKANLIGTKVSIYCNDCKEDLNSFNSRTSILEFYSLKSIVFKMDYCKNCGLKAAEELPKVDNLFHTMILSHGLATGFLEDCSKDTITMNFEMFLNNLGEHSFQVAASNKTQRIGPIGIYLKGYNLAVSNIDLGSVIIDGKRYIEYKNRDFQKSLVCNIEDYRLQKRHSEHIVVPNDIIGVWVKSWCYEYKDLIEIAETFKHFCEFADIRFHVVNVDFDDDIY